MTHLFVYGTLMADEVVVGVVGREVESLPAKVNGYKRVCLKDRVYPAVVKAKDDRQLSGKLLLGLNAKEFEVLDEYENEYERVTAQVLKEDGTQIEASVYVWASGSDLVIDKEWDYEGWWKATFKEHRLDFQDLL